jgi:uncharacterized protein with ParB-like and HNH nuclease domain
MALDSGEHSLGSMLKGSAFEIPEYQRYYSWDRKHLEELWEDLLGLTEREGDHKHYMGTVICKLENEDRYELVDGQQRFATLLILANSMDIETPDYFGGLELQKGDVDDNMVFQSILNGKNTEAKAPSQERLLEARDFFQEKIEETGGERQRKILENIESLEFMLYRIESDEKATLIFESINDRGKNLTRLEKTKSFLIHRTYLNTEDGEKRDKLIQELREKFAEIYISIQNIQNSGREAKTEDELQALHFASHIPEENIDKRKNAWNNHLEILKEYIKKGEELEKTQEYISSLSEFFKNYKKLLKRREDEEWEMIVSGKASYIMPLLIATPEEKFDEIVRVVEAAAFRTHYGTKRKDMGEETYFRIAYELKNGEKSVEEAIIKVKKTARLQ